MSDFFNQLQSGNKIRELNKNEQLRKVVALHVSQISNSIRSLQTILLDSQSSRTIERRT